MDPDELFTPKASDPLSLLRREDLDRLSVAELEERIAELEAEIARVHAKLGGAISHRSQADSLFRR